MVREHLVEHTETGLVPTGEGWFVLNAREARWRHADGRGDIRRRRRLPLDLRVR
jgi:hypothetical protein